MKQALTFLLLSLSFYGYSQEPAIKRSAIFFDNAGKFPEELGVVRNWLLDFTSQLPYMYRNGKSSANNDAEFRQFSFGSKKAQRFAIGNSGCFFETDSIPVPLNVQYEGKWKIAAYDPSFELNEFKPGNNEQIFTTSLLLYNISEEQAVAQFLNNYVPHKDHPVLEQLLADVEHWSGKKLDIKYDNNLRLKSVTQEIYSKTNEYASAVCYKIYLKDKDHKKESENLNRFFRSFLSVDAIRNFFDKVTPEGKFYFQKQGISVTLPNNIFLYVDDKNKPVPASQVSFTASFDFASYKIFYDDNDKPYFNLKFEKLHFKNPVPSFQFKEEYTLNKNYFKLFPFKQRRTFTINEVKEINCQLYEGFFKVSVVIDEGHDSVIPFMVLEKKASYK
ncbi:hypothetical protein [Ferruginibacter profundus]